MLFIRICYRALRLAFYKASRLISWLVTCIKFFLNGVEFSRDFIAYGIPVIDVKLKGRFCIGKKFTLNSGRYYNMTGRQQPCFFIVANGAVLNIGDNVGVSGAAIVCQNQISIGNNVRIGTNVVIYDTDFHSLNVQERTSVPENTQNVRTKPVFINEGAFIGAHCTILKGVTIGRNAIIGAGSVLNRNVPDGQVWMGNPAVFIKNIN